MNLKFLKSENQLNKVIKRQKQTGSVVRILFVSLWDEWSNKLVDKLKNKTNGNDELYVVNSFSMPHSFVIYKTQKVPCLVTLGKAYSPAVVDDYLPSVYSNLDI
jgi:hypothetical protein